MNAPVRMMTVTDATATDGTAIPRWTPVWSFGQGSGGRIDVEWRGRRSALPASTLTTTPVPPPSPERLAGLDPCVPRILAGEWPLTERLRDDRMFVWWRCPHGAWYLDDTRGGIALYPTLTFVGALDGEPDDRALETLWLQWHVIPADALNWLGVALPPPRR